MFKLKVLKKYFDTKLEKKIGVGEVIEVDEERGIDLLRKASQNKLLGFAIIKIDKLSKKKNAKITGSKKGK
jgi:hypothetical protein